MTTISNLPIVDSVTIKTATSTGTLTLEKTNFGDIVFIDKNGHKQVSDCSYLMGRLFEAIKALG